MLMKFYCLQENNNCQFLINEKVKKTKGKYLAVSRRFFFLFLLLLPFTSTSNEPPVFDFVSEIHANTNLFKIDNLSNLYWIEDGGLVKYTQDTGKRIQYSDKSFGSITAVDVADPLNIIVLFSEFNKIVFLDKNLAPRKVQKEDSFIENLMPSLVCSSRQNGFWLYSPVSYKLYKFSDNFEMETESRALNHQFPGFLQPFHMLEHNNQLFISDPSSGIWVFDQFASFLFIIPVSNVTFFQVRDNDILYFYEDQMGIYSIEEQVEEVFLLPEENVVQGYLHELSLYLLVDGSIKHYKVK